MVNEDQQKFEIIIEVLNEFANEVIGKASYLIQKDVGLPSIFKSKLLYGDEIPEMGYLPDFIDLLERYRCIEVSDGDEFFDIIEETTNLIIEIIFRSISLKMFAQDINDNLRNYNFYPGEERDLHLFLNLAVLESLTLRITKLIGKLEEEIATMNRIWYDYCFNRILPGDSESFHIMKDELMSALKEYIKINNAVYLNEFTLDLERYLDKFSEGNNPEETFNFVFSARTKYDLTYIDFNFESYIIEVSSGGSVYDPSVGSDSYTSWTYSIDLHGNEAGSFYSCEYFDISSIVGSYTKLTINESEKYMYLNDEYYTQLELETD